LAIETLERFYNDTRRKDSEEVRFGIGWRSANEPFEFVVFWVAETEELCLLRSPVRDVQSDGMVSRFILGIPPHMRAQELRDDEVTVEVIARISEHELPLRLEGWEVHHRAPDGIEWVRSVVS
jgi:hypothetical protein